MLGFIGVGNMAGAIITGILKHGLFKEKEIAIYDKDNSKYERFSVQVMPNIKELCEKSDIIFLCIKPQIYNDVLKEITDKADKSCLSDKTFVTIAAGISTEFICKKLSYNAAVIRVMPNTPLLIGEGASALCANANVDKRTFSSVVEIFSTLGVCKILTEDLMNKIIAVNGSSPAYVYLFAKAICDGAKKQGIDEDVLPLVIQTMIGSAKMMAQSGKSPDELIKMVASPNGTTLAALNSFENDKFCETVMRAMQKCTDRAEEIAKETESK